MNSKLFVSTFASAVLATLPLAAQDAPAPTPQLEAEAPASSDPTFRFDVTLPSVGVVGASADGAGWQVGLSLRLAHESGHGARFDLSGGQTDGVQLLSNSAFVSTESYDFSYFYRVRLAGNDRLGLGVDFGVGLSVQALRFHQPSSFWGSDPAPVSENLADGLHLGGVAVAALDGRIYGFIFGADVRAHAVAATQGQSNDARAQYDVSLNATIGFGFH